MEMSLKEAKALWESHRLDALMDKIQQHLATAKALKYPEVDMVQYIEPVQRNLVLRSLLAVTANYDSFKVKKAAYQTYVETQTLQIDALEHLGRKLSKLEGIESIIVKELPVIQQFLEHFDTSSFEEEPAATVETDPTPTHHSTPLDKPPQHPSRGVFVEADNRSLRGSEYSGYSKGRGRSRYVTEGSLVGSRSRRSQGSDTPSAIARRAAAEKAAADARLRATAESARRDQELLAKQQEEQLRLKEQLLAKQKEEARRKAQRQVEDFELEADRELLNFKLNQANESGSNDREKQRMVDEARIEADAADAANQVLQESEGGSRKALSVDLADESSPIEKVQDYLNTLPPNSESCPVTSTESTPVTGTFTNVSKNTIPKIPVTSQAINAHSNLKPPIAGLNVSASQFNPATSTQVTFSNPLGGITSSNLYQHNQLHNANNIPTSCSGNLAAGGQAVGKMYEGDLSGAAGGIKGMDLNVSNNSVIEIGKLADLVAVDRIGMSSDDHFDGSVSSNYFIFITMFNTLTKNMTDASMKLSCLRKWTKGKANSAISHTIYQEATDPEGALQDALATLQKRFGKTHKLMEYHVEKLIYGKPCVKEEHGALDGLIEELKHAKAATCLIPGGLTELRSPYILRKIVNKRVSFLKAEWMKRSVKLAEINIDHFIAFLEEQSEMYASTFGFASYGGGLDRFGGENQKSKNNNIKNNEKKPTTNAKFPPKPTPVKVGSAPAETKPKELKSKKEPDSSSSTTLESCPIEGKKSKPEPPCPCCKESHFLWKCVKFKEKAPHERLQLTNKLKLCHICLSEHKPEDCQSKLTCYYCKKRHNSLFHGLSFNTGACEAVEPIECALIDSDFNGSRPVVAVLVHCKETGLRRKVWAMFDSGSDISYILDDSRRKLGMPVISQPMCIGTLEHEGEIKARAVVTFDLCSLVSSEFVLSNVSAVVAKTLPVQTCIIPSNKMLTKHAHFEDISIQESEDKFVSMIIGINEPSCWNILESRIGRGRRDPVGWLTPFGWGIVGEDRKGPKESACTQLTELEEVHAQLKRMWMTDFNDIDGHRLGMSKQDRRALSTWEKSAKYVLHQDKDHVQLALPWVEGDRSDVSLPPLREWESMAKRRMSSLKKRLLKNPQEFEMVKAQIDRLKADGHARVLPPDEVVAPPGCPQVILPLVLAYHPAKKDEVRVCFDASAKVKNVSLNSKLLTGPDLLTKMLGVCIRFREYPVTIEGDVKRMFLQVRLDPRDCWAKCFYFWKNNSLDEDLELHQLLIQMFGAAPSPGASTFALRKVASDYSHLYPEEVVAAIIWNFYVDDLKKSMLESEKVISLMHDLISLLGRGGFRLTKLTSNCPEVVDEIPPEDRLECPEDSIDKALGITYDRSNDIFLFKLHHLQERPDPVTPRQCLSFNASPFDQFGQVSPAFLKSKKALQVVLQLKYGWDDKVPPELLKEIWKCKSNVHLLEKYAIPRCFMPLHLKSKPEAVIAVFFVDACETGYGGVGYLILHFPNGMIHVAFLIGKSLVTPFKVPTIPRLELTSARTGIRLAQAVIPELTYEVARTFYFTDSQSTLRKLANDKDRFKTFDCNRLVEILEYSELQDWDFVRTNLNPADLVSRGIDADDEEAWRFYHQGPDFLYLPQDQWPREEWDKKLTKEDLIEVKKECGGIELQVSAVEKAPIQPSLIDQFTKSSTWNALVVRMSWFKRIAMFWKLKASNRKSGLAGRIALCKDPVRLKEFLASESFLIKLIQHKYFGQLITFLSALKPNIRLRSEVPGQADATALRGDKKEVRSQIHRLGSSMQRLDPALHEGFLRVGGRFLHSGTLTFESRHQIILPADDQHVRLLIEDLHLSHGHSGREFTFNKSREKYWLMGGRRIINKVIHRCFKCRKMLKPVMSQQMAPLPEARISIGYPFQDTGVDYAGPFYVYQYRNREKKVWIVIFACLRTRAVHIELVDSLTSAAFINALIRFKNRKGQPTDIWSDNGSNFVGADKELKEWLIEWQQSGDAEFYTTKLRIQWHWSAPLASHTSGHIESMIRPLRRILTAISTENKLNSFEEMSTLLTEVESILNNRPLMPVSAEPGMPRPITPALLLFPHSEVHTFPQGLPDEAPYHKKRWKVVQHVVSTFWKRWSKEYLQYLQRRMKWHLPERVIQKGDLVMMVSEAKCRTDWPLAVVQEVFPSTDELVRKVVVRVSSGKTFVRDLRKLVLLEESQSLYEEAKVSSATSNPADESNITSSTSDMEINSNVQTDLQGSEDDVDNQGGPS